MIEIPFDEWEWKLGERLGRARHEIAIRSGYFREQGNRNDPIDGAIQGVTAELAWYKLRDKFPIINQEARNAGTADDIVDNITIDVKGTGGVNNDLMVSIEVEHRFDRYVLIVLDKPRVYYIGYIDSDKLFLEKNIYYPQPKDGVERTPFYRAHQSQLTKEIFW